MKTKYVTIIVVVAGSVLVAAGCGGKIDGGVAGPEGGGATSEPVPSGTMTTSTSPLEGIFVDITVFSTGTPEYQARELRLTPSPQACGGARPGDTWIEVDLVGDEQTVSAGRYTVAEALAPFDMSATRRVLDSACQARYPPGGNYLALDSFVEVTAIDSDSVEGNVWLIFGKDGTDRVRAPFRATQCDHSGLEACH